MTRLLAGLIVFILVSPAVGAGKDKNWGDKQTGFGKQTDPNQSKLHEKEGKFGLEKEKIEPMKSERKK